MRKEREHLRIRLGPDLVKRIDAARKASGRTRSAQIKLMLDQALVRMDMQEVVRETLRQLGKNGA
jgi:predicted DNA-binding protein